MRFDYREKFKTQRRVVITCSGMSSRLRHCYPKRLIRRALIDVYFDGPIQPHALIINVSPYISSRGNNPRQLVSGFGRRRERDEPDWPEAHLANLINGKSRGLFPSASIIRRIREIVQSEAFRLQIESFVS